MYTDGPKFREAVSSLGEGVRSEVLAKINDAMVGFNTRVENSGIDYNPSITSEEESMSFSSYIKDYSDKLSAAIDSVLSHVDESISAYAYNRPLLRATGNRIIPPIVFDKPITIKYEFQNVGSNPWTGWMNVKVVDEYKKSIGVDFPPANIPTVPPGDSVTLIRDVTIPKVLYVDGNPRTWGKKSKVQISIYTRGV